MLWFQGITTAVDRSTRPWCVAGNTTEGGHVVGYASPDLHYYFDLESPTMVTFDVCQADFRVYLRIVRGMRTGDFYQQAGQLGGCPSGSTGARISASLLAGTGYAIVVEGYGNDMSGVFNMTMASCQPLPSSQRGSIQCGETLDGDTTDGFHIAGYTSEENYFDFVVTNTTLVTFDSCDSSFRTSLRLYYTAAVAQTQITSSISGCSPTGAVLSRTLDPGNYTIMIEGYVEHVCILHIESIEDIIIR